jgi:hypothetical protein
LLIPQEKKIYEGQGVVEGGELLACAMFSEREREREEVEILNEWRSKWEGNQADGKERLIGWINCKGGGGR